MAFNSDSPDILVTRVQSCARLRRAQVAWHGSPVTGGYSVVLEFVVGRDYANSGSLHFACQSGYAKEELFVYDTALLILILGGGYRTELVPTEWVEQAKFDAVDRGDFLGNELDCFPWSLWIRGHDPDIVEAQIVDST